METLDVRTGAQIELLDLTGRISSLAGDSDIEEGFCCVYVPHTTAGITINENADPSVKKDLLKELNKIIPLSDNYAHAEGNSAAHIKSSVMGQSVIVPIEGGKLALGTWQGIFFCEFDGPRSRQVHVFFK
ncbi:MAG: secondary thiamine-phosphate synthase enzyme YjbQ [Candidatus Brocadiia bacterium]